MEAEVRAGGGRRRRRAARAIGRSMRVPSFRAGKAPAPVVIKRVSPRRPSSTRRCATRSATGTPRRSTTPRSSRSANPTSISASFPPTARRSRSRSRSASGRRPSSASTRGLEVGKRDPEVADEAIDAEIERLRERSGRLETVDRAAAEERLRRHGLPRHDRRDGLRRRRGRDRDGRARLRPPRPRLRGSARRRDRGEERTVTVSFLTTTAPRSWPARRPSSRSRSRRSRRRSCPTSTTTSPAEAGFDTLDEHALRHPRAAEGGRGQRIDAEFRETVLDAAVANATIDVPEALSDARSRELWDQMGHSLGHQGISKEMYLQISGRSEEDIVAEGRQDARRQLKREAVLAAIVAAEEIEAVRRGRALEALETPPRRRHEREEAAPERLGVSGRLDSLHADLASRQALQASSRSRRSRSRWSRRAPATSSGRPTKALRKAPEPSSGHPGPDPSVDGSGGPWAGPEVIARLAPRRAGSTDARREGFRRRTRNEARTVSPLVPMVVEQTSRRRARVRHLLPGCSASGSSSRAPRWTTRSRTSSWRGCCASSPRSRQGHLALHQLAGRLRLRRAGDLRHDAVHQAGRVDDLRGRRHVDGRAAAGERWREGQAHGAAERES